MVAHIIGHHGGQLVAAVEHGQHDALHGQRAIQPGLHGIDGAHQLRQPFQRVEFALERHQDRRSSRQCVHSQHAERRGAIDDDVVI